MSTLQPARTVRLDDLALQGTADRHAAPLVKLYSAAALLDLPVTTLKCWAVGRTTTMGGTYLQVRDPMLSGVGEIDGEVALSFHGLVQADVLRLVASAGVPLEAFAEVVASLERRSGIHPVLAHERFRLEGAAALAQAVGRDPEMSGLVRVDDTVSFAEPLATLLRHHDHDDEGWVSRFVLPLTDRPVLEVTADAGDGEPRFIRGGGPAREAADAFRRGEGIETIAHRMGCTVEDVEDAFRGLWFLG